MNEPFTVKSFTEIEAAVQRAIALAQERYGRPTYVELSSGESVMGIVVGGERSYAVFVYSAGRGYFTLHHGEPRDESTQPFLYMMGGSLSEADPETTILPEEAWEALRLYFETGKRPETLEWGPQSEPGRLLEGATATVVRLHALPGAGSMQDLSLDATHTCAVGAAQAMAYNAPMA